MIISDRIRAKLRGTISESNFCWLEEKKNKKSRFIPTKYYKGFKLNSQSYYEGDCVLINVDIQFGFAEEKFEVARIIECYNNGDKNYKGFIKVQWFTPFDQIRKAHRKYFITDYPPMDPDVEIVKDLWTYENEVDIETISGHCHVKEVPASFSPSSVKRPADALGPMYICRFSYKNRQPFIYPLTEKDVFRITEAKSPFALKEITNSPKNKNVSANHSSKSKSSVSAKKRSEKSIIIHQPEQNENICEGKRRVKRKLLDLEEDQENICSKRQKKENEPVFNNGHPNSRPGWSPLKRNAEGSTPQKSTLSPIKKNISLSSPFKDKLSVLLSPLKNRVSSPLKDSKREIESPKVSMKSPLIDRIIGIKTIGECRGLRQGEISDLLVDEENNDGPIIPEEESDDDDFQSSVRPQKVGTTPKSGKYKKELKTCLDINEEEIFFKATPTRSLRKRSEEEGNCVELQRRTKESHTLQTSVIKEEEKTPVRSSSKRRGKQSDLTTPEKAEDRSSIKNSKELEIKESSIKLSKVNTPKSTRKGKKDEALNIKTPKGKGKHLVVSQLPDRSTPIREKTTEFELAKAQLHVSAVPSYLPCREEEYQQIYSFVEGKLLDSTGGCMYVSGVPGTGKTATIREVLKILKECEKEGVVPQFQFLEVNAMKLTKPNQLWVQIWEGLTGQRVTPDHAYSLFVKSLGPSSGPKRKSIFLLLDELDLLWTKKQDVMYNLFDLASQGNSRLIVITIANTMDLPERMMMSRVQSRLGLTRMTFQPYTFQQLQEIITSRLQGIRAFDADAIQLVARKVAAVSGDARRALDICRRATELAELKKIELILSPIKSPKKINVLVGMSHVTLAINEMFSSPKVLAIRQCSQMVKYLLQAILTEFTRTGIEEALLMRVLEHLDSICRLDGLSPPASSDAVKLVNVLSAQKIIFTEHSRLDLTLRIRLNISTDDVSYALSL